MGLGFIVGFLGLLILFHAAYSTIQYRALLKITEEDFSGPPLNVVLELSLGLVICLWAALTLPGKFLSIHPDSEENRFLSQLLLKKKITLLQMKLGNKESWMLNTFKYRLKSSPTV